MSFSGLKSSYAKSARANEKSHNVLKDVWAHVNPMAGLLVSQAGLVSANDDTCSHRSPPQLKLTYVAVPPEIIRPLHLPVRADLKS